jgi:hypothetical protein
LALDDFASLHLIEPLVREGRIVDPAFLLLHFRAARGQSNDTKGIVPREPIGKRILQTHSKIPGVFGGSPPDLGDTTALPECVV